MAKTQRFKVSRIDQHLDDGSLVIELTLRTTQELSDAPPGWVGSSLHLDGLEMQAVALVTMEDKETTREISDALSDLYLAAMRRRHEQERAATGAASA